MEYNLKITTDDSELQSTQDLLVEIGDTANDIQDEVEGAFNSEPVEAFTAATEDAASALGSEAAAAKNAAASQEQLNKATDKGTKGNKRLGSSLLTNALRMAGFSKEARIAGAALNILNKVSLKKIGSAIKGLGVSILNVVKNPIASLRSAIAVIGSAGATAFKALGTAAKTASTTIKGALAATGIGAVVLLVGLLIANFDKVKDALRPLGDVFSSVFGGIKDTINGIIASTRDLLSTVTGGLIDSAERAAERTAQLAREANTDALKSTKDTLSEITSLRDSAYQKEIAQAKALGATQEELDQISIKNNKEKAAFLTLELNKQQEVVGSLKNQIKELDKIGSLDEDQAKARSKAFEESLKAQSEVNKIQRQIAQTSIDNAKIVEDASDREKEAIKKANDQRKEALRLEGLRKQEVEKLRDELLASEQERLIRQAQLEKEARAKRIEENVKDNDLKNQLIQANDQAFLQEKANIESSFAQARLDLENSITLNATDLKIQKINEETQARIESIQKVFGETEKADELILALQKQQADKIQDIQRKAREKERKEEEKRIKEILSIEAKKLEIARNTALQSVNIETQRGESEEEAAQRIADEKERIELEYQSSILESRLKFNTQLSDLDKQLLEQQIASIDAQIGAVKDKEQENNPFDFNAKLKDALNDLGLNDQEADKALQAANQFAGQLIAQYEAAVDARLQAAQELVEFREDNIERLNQELANEIELNKQGLASNIERVQQEIAQEKQLRDEALAEQEAAARKKEQIETAQQAASLLTAIAQLYASLSALPFGIGIGIATGLSALLISQFAASKLKVGSVTKKRKGGLVDGASHEGGGVKYYSNESSNVVELEGNEFVTPVKQTKKHLRFLEAMRHGAFDNMDLMHAINNQSTLNSMNDSVVYYNATRDSSNNANVVAAINRAANINNRGLQDLQDRPTVYEANGYIYREVNKNGNKTVTKIKIN